VPDGFKKWINDNSGRIAKAEANGTVPYFLRDNYRDGRVQNGFTWIQKVTKDGNVEIILVNPETAQIVPKGYENNKYFERIDKCSSLDKLEEELRAILETVRSLQDNAEIYVTINKDVSIDVAKLYSKQLIQLSKEYNIQGKLTDVTFKNVNMLNGKPHKELGVVTYPKKLGSSKTLMSDSRLDTGRLNGLASKCDADKIAYSTPTHEFGHLIFVKAKAGEIDPRTARVFLNGGNGIDGVEQLFKKYKDEMKKIEAGLDKADRTNNAEDYLKFKQQKDNTYLGEYGSIHDIDEFIAECFQEYKNYSAPTKYASEVGKLIDKYFKK
jgi:hypothetical protein